MGGGATGLAAAKELLAAGHAATVYEASDEVGGIWAYRDATDDHPLGLGARTQRASMYAGLRTNLPREVMGFLDWPFDAQFPGSQDPRRFCGHAEVRARGAAPPCPAWLRTT